MRRVPGIADDKAIYSYMPEIVEFYTGESAALLNNVQTWRCSEPEALAYVLDNLEDLVVKEVHGSGGYGMLIGPTATKKDIAAFRNKLKARPGNYIAQPTLSLSTVPIFSRVRRALGATRSHIASQFVLESALLAALGGVIGAALGAGVTYGYATRQGWRIDIPTEALGAGVAVALALGALAGLYPAVRAARLDPADAVRPSG